MVFNKSFKLKLIFYKIYFLIIITLHSLPYGALLLNFNFFFIYLKYLYRLLNTILIYGLSPKQLSHKIGNSEFSHPMMIFHIQIKKILSNLIKKNITSFISSFMNT